MSSMKVNKILQPTQFYLVYSKLRQYLCKCQMLYASRLYTTKTQSLIRHYTFSQTCPPRLVVA